MLRVLILATLCVDGWTLNTPAQFGHALRDELNTPAQFGHALRDEFAMAEGYTNLNHGSYGVVPKPVSNAQDSWRAEQEANPDKW